MAGEIRPGELLRVGQRVVAAAGKHERIVSEWCEIEIGARGPGNLDAEINFAFCHRIKLLTGRQIENAKTNALKFVVE